MLSPGGLQLGDALLTAGQLTGGDGAIGQRALQCGAHQLLQRHPAVGADLPLGHLGWTDTAPAVSGHLDTLLPDARIVWKLGWEVENSASKFAIRVKNPAAK